MVLDHHVHTQFGDRLKIDAFDLASAAEAAGIRYLGFAENFPLPPSFADKLEEDKIMPVEDFEHYVDTVRGVRAEFADRSLKVLIGTEVDWLPGYRMFIEHLLQRHGRHLDFVALALHYVGHQPITLSRPHLLEARREVVKPQTRARRRSDSRPASDTIVLGLAPPAVAGAGNGEASSGSYVDDCAPAADALIREYYECVLDGVTSGLFDIVAHLDIVKKFDKRSGEELAGKFEAEIDAILEAMAATQHMALELNMSGIDMFCHEPFPTLSIVERAVDFGIPLTLGSDATSSTAAGRHFPEACRILQALGVTELACYEKRTLRKIDVANWVSANKACDGAA
ncbi:MAG: hypothetical protein AB7S36_02160 [Planctomycetota bacterium]